MNNNTKNYNQKRNKNRKYRNRNHSPTKKKKELNDYVYYTGSHKQASDYEKTTEFLINYIKGEYAYGNDIAESIRNGAYVDSTEWYPKLEVSTESNPDKKRIEDTELQMKYKAKLDATIKRETMFDSNKTKAYSLIWERCTLSMQSQLEQRTDFETKIYNNPINLINAIKEQTMNFQDTKYDMEIIDNSLTHFLLTRQKDEELHEYTKRFKSSKQVLESHLGGPIKLSKIVYGMDTYNSTDDKKNSGLYADAWERFSAYKYLKNANHEKYGDVLKHLRERKGIGKNEFPKTIIEAINTLNAFKSTNKEKSNKIQRNNNRKQEDDKNLEIQNKEENTNMRYTFSTIEGRCYICGKPGHKSPQCKMKAKIPKEEWAITKAKQSHAMAINESVEQNDQMSTISNQSKQQGWTSVHVIYNQGNSMKNKIILDSGSSTTLFCNKNYCNKIKNTKNPIDIHTNGGTLQVKESCELPEIGESYYDKNAMTNIIGLSDMRKKFRITYDSEKEAAFLIHTPAKIIKFAETSEGIYAIDMEQKKKNENENKENNIKENTCNIC